MFWGITPSLDLLEEYLTQCEDYGDEINVLIIGGNDLRHIFKTISNRKRHKHVKINFYIMETLMELVAKQLLLLCIALQPPLALGLGLKTRIFMELYGNTLVSPPAYRMLKSTAKELIEMVSNYNYLEDMMPFVQLDLLYKERDYLENVFKFWAKDEYFDIPKYWDQQVRKNLGIRYDTKMGAFDWDLHMRYHSVGGEQICSEEYRRWRSTGVAFTFLESEVSKPNRSLVCGILRNGEDFGHFGYMGDIQTGPYVSYGLHCEDKQFLKRNHGQNVHRSTDVTERNLQQIIHEIQNDDNYVYQSAIDFTLGTAIFNYSDLRCAGENYSAETCLNKIHKCTSIEGVQINVLSIKNLKYMTNRKAYKNFFNIMYFGACYLNHFEQEVMEYISAPKSLLIVENSLFVLKYRDKDLDKFKGEILTYARSIQPLVEVPFDHKFDAYAKFVLKETIALRMDS